MKNFSKSLLLSLSLLTTSCFAAPQPNILFILSDDAGYHDFGFHGSKTMITPNLDKLAKQGTHFNQAYVSAAVCGPSRAGLLTGRYQQKFGFEENNVPSAMSNSGIVGDEMGLPLNEKIMPQYLKEQGYKTALIGKWHQGNADRFHPSKRGFDYFYGFRGGARSYYPLTQSDIKTKPENRLETNVAHYEESPLYLTDAFANKTIEFMEKNKNQPFFAYLSFTAVHSPMQAEQQDLAKFPQLKGKRKSVAAMTLSMDRAIGRVLAKLDELGIADNTLVIFTNDNGGPTDSNASNNAPLSGSKANHLEGGIRVPFIIRWPGKVTNNKIYNNPISTLDLLPTFIAAAGGNTEKLKHLDGVDLLPYITGENQERPHQALYWKKENRGVIRDGDWKLLRYPDRPAELFDLSKDASERHDLATKHPEKVKALYKKLFAWELTLERPLWQLRREYEGKAMIRMDKYRKHILD